MCKDDVYESADMVNKLDYCGSLIWNLDDLQREDHQSYSVPRPLTHVGGDVAARLLE